MEKVVIGDATLYCMDNREYKPKTRFDLMVTDPPYGTDILRKGYIGDKSKGLTPTQFKIKRWDKSAPDLDHLNNLLAMAHYSILWGGNYYSGLSGQSKWLVWDKMNNGYFADCELAWTNLPGAVRLFRYMWNGMIRDSEQGEKRIHPIQKPIKLMQWCIHQASDANSIFDPFMGSGSSAVAALSMGKSYVGIELEPDYFESACERIEQSYQIQQQTLSLFDEFMSDQITIF